MTPLGTHSHGQPGQIVILVCMGRCGSHVTTVTGMEDQAPPKSEEQRSPFIKP